MPRPQSPKPDKFANDRESYFWHSAQDVAFRAGLRLLYRDGCSWLESEEGERLLCKPLDPDRIWYESWVALEAEYPQLKRTWIGGYAREHRGGDGANSPFGQ